MIVQKADLTKCKSIARLSLQDRLYVAARPAGEFTKHQQVLVILPLFARVKLLAVYLNFSMSALHKPSQRNSRKPETKQQLQPTSNIQLLSAQSSSASVIGKTWLQPEINSLVTLLLVQYPISHVQGCNNIYM